uniref:hypothetical protein n=1 Tax=Histophilus somni TaxID=731 RepID=UPI00201E86CC
VVTDKLTNLSEGIQKFNYSVKDHIYTTNYTVYVVRGQGLNIDELVELLSKAKSINSDNYIEETVNELEQAIQQAEEVLAKGLPSQEEVDKASEKLKQALSKLEEPVSEEEKEPLRELLKKAKTVDKTLYTPISVEVLETAIKNAEDLLAKEKVSRRELADAQEKLQNALDDLVELDPKFLS